MMNSRFRALSLMGAALMSSISVLGDAFFRPAAPARSGGMGPGYQPTPSRKYKHKSKAKIGRTFRVVKAEGEYGRNLRKYFDSVRLTRSQRNRFYAGKPVY